MALKAYRQGNPKQEIFNDRTKCVRLRLTLNEPYVTGGYSIDLEIAAGLDITYIMSSTFGGYQIEYDVLNKKFIVFKGGFEVANGQSFYDAVTGLYATFVLECYSVVHFRDEVQFQNPATLLSVSPEISAKTLDGIEPTQFLRNDINDGTGAVSPVTTTINQGSVLEVAGELCAVSEGNRVVEVKPTGISVNTPTSTTVEIKPTGITNIGETIKPILKTFAVGVNEPNISGAEVWYLDGSITTLITNFFGGVDGTRLEIHCIANGCTLSISGAHLILRNGEDYAIKDGDVIAFKYNALSGFWVEINRQEKNGSNLVNDGGAITVGVGGSINLVGQMTQDVGTEFGVSATPSVVGGTFFALDGAVTSSITNFIGGVEGQVIAIACIGSGNTITPSGNITTQGGVPITPKAGDQIVFKMISGVWVEQPRGNTATGEVGALTVVGPIVRATPTPITSDAQDVSLANHLIVATGSPITVTAPLNTLSTTKDKEEITITFQQAATMAHATGNIHLSGGVDWSATANSSTVLVYDLATDTWNEDASRRNTVV